MGSPGGIVLTVAGGIVLTVGAWPLGLSGPASGAHPYQELHV